MRPKILLLCGVLVLAGCGSEGNSSQEENLVFADMGAPTESATIERPTQESGEGSGQDVDCGNVKRQTAPQGQPDDDIVGIRRGMSEKQVKDILTCRKANYAITSTPQNATVGNGVQVSHVNVVGNNGLDKVSVWLVGPPGAERVYQVDRIVEYAEGKGLPVESIKQEISKKYGNFDVIGSNPPEGNIVRALGGEQLALDNSNYQNCRTHYLSNSVTVPCLSHVSYRIDPSSDNPALARRFSLAITNHMAAAQMVKAAEKKNASDLEKARQTAKDQGIEL